MHARLLGWAGVQLDADGSTLVIDPLADAAAVWAPLGERAREVPVPEVVAAGPAGAAAAGLVTHLHRDHADAGALAAALAPGAPVFVPASYGGTRLDQAALAQAHAELERSGLDVRPLEPWTSVEHDGWRLTALPAADGIGDPQVSWLVERDGVAVVHAGDTMLHGWWWRIAQLAAHPIEVAFLPVNGARVSFPHRQAASPLPAVMTAEQAAVAASAMGARRLVPIHHGGYEIAGVYTSDADALARLRAAATIEVLEPALGERFELGLVAA